MQVSGRQHELTRTKSVRLFDRSAVRVFDGAPETELPNRRTAVLSNGFNRSGEWEIE